MSRHLLSPELHLKLEKASRKPGCAITLGYKQATEIVEVHGTAVQMYALLLEYLRAKQAEKDWKFTGDMSNADEAVAIHKRQERALQDIIEFSDTLGSGGAGELFTHREAQHEHNEKG